MRRALVIPKAVAAAVCLIIGLILIIPTLPVMTSRLFGGGMVDFNEESYKDYSENRPVSGRVYYAFGSMGTSVEDDKGIPQNIYYYLVPLNGKPIDSKNKAEAVVLIKVHELDDAYKDMNEIVRASANGSSETGCEISGVLKPMSELESGYAQKLREKVPDKSLPVVEYEIDLSVSPKGMLLRFLLSVVFFAAAAFAVYLTVSAVKKNADIERIEDERMVYKMEQERKSGNTNEDGSDKMFGDSDASFGTTPRKDGSAGSYTPSFQSQGGEEFTPRDDPPREIDEDGFLGGGGSFFGAAPQQSAPAQQGTQYPAQGGYSQQSSDPFAGSAFNDLGSDDDGFFGGQGGGSYGGQGSYNDGGYGQGGFYGGSQGGSDDDDDGFFIKRN